MPSFLGIECVKLGDARYDTARAGILPYALWHSRVAPARAQIRDLVAQDAPEAASPDTIAKQWFIEKGCNRLLELLDETDLPDRMVVACCAWLEIHDVSHGAHLLHNSRTTPKPDFANFTQTPEERGGPALRQLHPDQGQTHARRTQGKRPLVRLRPRYRGRTFGQPTSPRAQQRPDQPATRTLHNRADVHSHAPTSGF